MGDFTSINSLQDLFSDISGTSKNVNRLADEVRPKIDRLDKAIKVLLVVTVATLAATVLLHARK